MEDRYEVRRGLKTYYKAYTKQEIEKAWDTDGQGHEQAVARGEWCVVIPCRSKEVATTLAALFVRYVFAIPTCTHWDGKTLSLYCGDAGSRAPHTFQSAENIALGYMAAKRAVPNLFSLK